MTDNTVSSAIEKRDTSPAALVDRYPTEFTSMLPSHVNGESWLRAAKAALKKGKVVGGQFELEVAARNNPGAFFTALREAASLGLRPGSKEYYLTPRKVKGTLEILGIVGYQGHIELMYRAGAVASVVAELVYTADQFSYTPGADDVPLHEIDWDAESRGDIRLVYAYARMKGGGYSKVVILNRAAIDKIKQSAQGASSDYSPWKVWPESMWLKSAVRQLEKWVPTSAEYREALIRDAVAVQSARTSAPTEAVPAELNVDTETGEIHDAEVVEPPE